MIPLAASIVGVILLLFSLWYFYKSWRWARQTFLSTYSWVAPVIQEVNLAEHPLPPKLEPLASRLAALELQPIGVTHAHVWQVGEGYTWYYRDSEGRIYAELVEPMDGMAAFSTWFADEAHIVTYYPRGENIQTANFHARFAAHDLEVAYAYHQEQVKRWQAEHGSPVIFKSVADVIPYSRIYRKRYRFRMMLRLTSLTFARMLIYLVLALSALALAVPLFSTTESTLVPCSVVIFLLLWIMASGLLTSIQQRIKSPSGAIDRRQTQPRGIHPLNSRYQPASADENNPV